MNTDDLHGKTALVTGAGSGIGRETARLLAARGADLFLCDVNEEGLAETARQLETVGRTVFAREVDVADREQMRAFAEAVHERVPAVDLLVNNAGVGLAAGFLETELEDWDWIVGINLMGVVYGCHFFLPKMIERGSGGHVVNVSSAAGFYATEPLCAYSATKFGVFGLSESMRGEMHRHGIGVTAICPGIIDTAITRTSRVRGDFERPDFREQLAGAYERRGYGPDRVAKNILKAVHKNRAVAPVSPEAWFMFYLKRLAPGVAGWLSRRVADQQRRQVGS